MSKIVKMLALALVLMLALSGCKMVAVDKAVDVDTVVAEYKGGTITKGEALEEYNDVVAMYQAYGYGDAFEDAEFVAGIKKDVLDYMVSDRVIQEKAKELGVDAIPEDKRQELIKEAIDEYDSLVSMYRASFEQEGMTDDEAIAATKAGLETQMGVNEEIMKNYALSEHKDQMLVDAVTADVTVTDDDLKAAYDEQVAADQETYAADPGAYDSAIAYGESPLYVPEGVRTVKHILIKTDSDLMAEQTELQYQLEDVEFAIEEKTAPADADGLELELTEGEGDSPTEGVEAAAVGGATIDNTGDEPISSEPDPIAVEATEPPAEEAEEPAEEAAAPAEQPVEDALADDQELLDDEFDVDESLISDEDFIPADTEEEPEEDLSLLTLDELNARKADLEQKLADIDAKIQESLAPKVAEVQAKIDAGEDFAALIDEYGEDPGMQNEPNKTTGYYVSANSTMWDPAFKDGAMALEKVGDVSGPVYGQNGCHFIRYESDVTPGPVDFETVKESLRESALELKKSEVYDAQITQWIEEAEAKIYPEKL